MPTHDLIGGSEGSRTPGYVISIEPGASLSLGKNFFNLSAPVAVERHASRAVADIRNNFPTGAGAFADFLIIASYSRRF